MAEAFGAARYARSVWQLRPGPAVDGLCFVARDGDEIVGSLRFWQVKLGDEMVLLLGPLAVLPALRGKGCGRALVETGLNQAKNGPWRLVLVSGEVDYYPKFGFAPPFRTGPCPSKQTSVEILAIWTCQWPFPNTSSHNFLEILAIWTFRR